jgi:hypothetical protein
MTVLHVGKSACADDTEIVQPFINETTLIVIKVNPAQLALPELPESIKTAFLNGTKAYDRWAEDVMTGIELFRSATDGQPIYATIGIPPAPKEWPAFLFVKETSGANHQKLVDLVSKIQENHSYSRGGFTVLMPRHSPDVQASLKRKSPSVRDALPDAFDAVKDYPIQVLILPPDYVRRTMTELMPQLPQQLGGGPSTLLTDGLVWAAVGIDPGQARAELIIQSRSEQAAQNLNKHLPPMLVALYDEMTQAHRQLSLKTFESLVALAKTNVQGDRITIQFNEVQALSEALRLLSNAPRVIGERMRRQTNVKRFKQILLAMHNYHDTYQMFPPRDKVRDANGKTGLSWRVHLLPFLEEIVLYRQFALDEPWDSPNNKPLLEKMPKVFQSQWLGINPAHTTFLAPVGEDTIYGGTKSTKFFHIRDGTSNTIVLVEVKPSQSVPWTAPRDYKFDPKTPGSGLRAGADGLFLSALCDGSVHMLPATIPGEMLLRLFQKSDGQLVDWDKVR